MWINGTHFHHVYFWSFNLYILFNICNKINPISSHQTPFHLLGTSFAYPLSVSLAESAPKTLTVFWYCLEFHRVSLPFPYFLLFLFCVGWKIGSGSLWWQLPGLLSHNCRLQAKRLWFSAALAAAASLLSFPVCFGFQFAMSSCLWAYIFFVLVLASNAFLFVCYLCLCENILILIVIAITIVSLDNFPLDIQDFNRQHLP